MKISSFDVNNERFTVFDDVNTKSVRSKSYNFDFDKRNGLFFRWGRNKEDDPDCAPSCEILDIEVTTICEGVPGKNDQNGRTSKRAPCKFCYKSNTPNGKNMSFETFKTVFDKVTKNKILTQLAAGADSQATSNPDLFKMLQYSRDNGVIPNLTVADISDKTADKIAAICGACAVSRYENKNVCYDSVKRLTDRGLFQTNIHVLISEETYDWIMETFNDSMTDERLSKLNAIVLLSLKKRGRGKNFTTLPQEKFKKIIDFALEKNIKIGMDSCSCAKFLYSVKNHKDYKHFYQCCDPCEAECFSQFIDCDGKAYPCSFCDGQDKWENGIDVVNCEDFVKDVWNNERTKEFRSKLLATAKYNDLGCRTCPMFEV